MLCLYDDVVTLCRPCLTCTRFECPPRMRSDACYPWCCHKAYAHCSGACFLNFWDHSGCIERCRKDRGCTAGNDKGHWGTPCGLMATTSGNYVFGEHCPATFWGPSRNSYGKGTKEPRGAPCCGKKTHYICPNWSLSGGSWTQP